MEMPLIARFLRPLADAVFGFDQRDEFLQEKIAVAHRAVGRIDVESSPAFRCGDEEFSYLVLLPEIVEQSPSAAVEESLLVVAQAMQEVKHGIALRRTPGCAGIVAGRKVNAIVDLVFQNPAVQRVAVDAALRVNWKRSSECWRTGR